ncbi:DoxX family protein [Mesorhizobium sp. M1A.F.Ca.IN.022.04.1.1]|uniref:DoxX family protein n=2 Tax=unclassified Mesorhizobium TaxID=325217 RepID=UPI000FCB6648|nr:DoxX family protein [Mesorhizobium sp. M1A.F.Ca.IN.022.04.1.1]RUV26206.1 DoxX family protein [Mesorhizobium sp. M1A.F.Ca.IN.022.04.1.1]
MSSLGAQSVRSSSRSWNIALWVAQVLLFILFGMPGIMKTFLDPSALPPMGILWATDVPVWLLRFIGIGELAGALGMILPAATRILPLLTPLAALGFVAIQVLAIGFHAYRGETSQVLPLNLVYLALSIFVMWGRARKAPIASRR